MDLREGHRSAVAEDPHDQVAQGATLNRKRISDGRRQGREPGVRRPAAVRVGDPRPKRVTDAPQFAEKLAASSGQTSHLVVQGV